MQAAASNASSATGFGIGMVFASGVPPVFTETKPAASIMRSNAERSTTRSFFFFKQKTAYEFGLGIPAEPLFRSNQNVKKRPACSELRWAYCNHKATYFASYLTGGDCVPDDQN